MLFLLLVLNALISTWNAYATGRAWVEARAMGGWARLLAYSGYVMAASGFTSVFAAVLAIMAETAGVLSPEMTKLCLDLAYATIILPVLGSGMIIWLDSLREAWRRRSVSATLTAAWNTYAQFQNVSDAVSFLPDIVHELVDAFDFDDDDGPAGLLILIVVAIVAVGLVGGIIATHLLFRLGLRESVRIARSEGASSRAHQEL